MFDSMLVNHAYKIEELEKKIEELDRKNDDIEKKNIELQEENGKVRFDFEQQREESLYYIDVCSKKDEETEKLKKDNES